MAAEFWKTKAFKEQQKEWKKILEESGFVDAEVETKGEHCLKQRATNVYRQADSLEIETKLDYYLCLSHHAINTEFEKEIEQLILLRHADGYSIKEIVEELESKNQSLNRRTIRFIIRRWQVKWGIRTWSPKQLNLRK